MPVHRVLFVCLGNICRSPLAEGVFRKSVEARALDKKFPHEFKIDSAGTGDWHIGAPPDPRAQHAAARRGIDLSGLRARQADADDMNAFDYIIAMDHANYASLRRLAGARHRHKVHLFLALCPDIDRDEVPDPYYGDAQGFDEVLDLIEQACEGLLAHIVQQ